MLSLSCISIFESTVSEINWLIDWLIDYAKAYIPAIKHELNMTDWQALFHSLSAGDSWTVFKDKLEMLEHIFIPVQTLRTKRKESIWMTHKAVKAVKHKR